MHTELVHTSMAAIACIMTQQTTIKMAAPYWMFLSDECENQSISIEEYKSSVEKVVYRYKKCMNEQKIQKLCNSLIQVASYSDYAVAATEQIIIRQEGT